MKKRTIEAKNIVEVKQKALQIFKVSEEQIDLKIIKEKKGILGIGSNVIVEASLNVDPFTAGADYIKKIIKNMSIDAKLEIIKSEKEVHYNIFSDNNGLLIGKEGKNLHALQFLVKQVINKYTDTRPIVLVDVGNYKSNKKKQLEILATKTAKEVALSGVEVKLDPMNAFERRIIHSKLSDWRDVITESEGKDPNRYLVIKPRRRK